MRASVLLRCIGFWILLLTSGIVSSQTIGALQVAPKSTPAGSGVSVFAVVQITAPDVIPSSVNLQKIDAQGRATIIGTLRDDGTEGDATANDRLFTLRFSVFEQNPLTLTYRVSAAVQGKVTRIFSAPATFSVTGTVGTGISITQPANLVFTNISPITVSGAAGDPGATVRVNGILASKSGTTFQASVPLQEGNNTLTAVAANTNNTQSTASVQVTLDTTPPRVTVDSPPSGFTTTDASITVTGMVNDIVVGTVNDKQAQVTVGGVAAQVSNRTFTATPVPLQLGLNTIPVIARDQTGNSATLNLRITREAATGSVIKILSGNNQSGTIGAPLATPLSVQLLDGTTPLANTHVFFKITENDGFLQPGTGKPQLVTVITDAQGKAQANLTLGNRAGSGNNTVEAYAASVKGTAIFTASGRPKSAANISVDSGTNQFGAVNQSLPLPFVVVVTDQGFNRLSGVLVTFTVRQGNGSINGAASVQTVTDSDGRALATLKLGTQPGQDNNVVDATFAGNTGLPAAFTASGKVPGNPALTTISGVVQDNSNNPIANVTMRLFKTNQGTANNQPVEVGTPVKTDAKGLFKISSAPVGFVKLMADGTTATQAGKQFPTLEYDIVTVAGQENGVGSPIYLPELDPNAKLCVDATTGGVLKLSKSPGFSLSVAPGSATFPGGSKTGCVTVTPVNPDKVPMVPGFGQQPRFVVTIQPVGTTFNPPAAISMPNMDGLAPNAKTEMYSFDHDLASFVAIGTGTVSQDGSTIASDPGVGVIKAGWHCGGNPNTTGSAGTCPTCQKCQGSNCVTDDTNKPPEKCADCKNGTPVPPKTEAECCADNSVSGNPVSDASTQAWVDCCSTKKITCNKPFEPAAWGGSGVSTLLDSCRIAHERQHFGDVDCPAGSDECKTSRPGFTPSRSQADGECDAYNVEVACLLKIDCTKVGATCQPTVDFLVKQLKQIANTRYKAGCFPP